MKGNASLIIKEVLTCIVLIAFALCINFLLFSRLFSNKIKVATAGTYNQIERKDYTVVNGNIQDIQNPTETYEATSNELETYQTEYRYEIGTINPFVSSDATNDLPQELVGQSGGEEAAQ